jgi:hypothetical protein
MLTESVRAVTGEPFQVFQDIDGIGLGEHWPKKIEDILEQATFFVPILTPSYFTSSRCREELQRFIKLEKTARRTDLILPIYYITTPAIEDAGLRAADPLAEAISLRQRYDWRELRFHPLSDRRVRRAFESLARSIGEARRREMLRSATLKESGIVVGRVTVGHDIHVGVSPQSMEYLKKEIIEELKEFLRPSANLQHDRPRNQIFISYSKKGKYWLQELQKFLKPVVKKQIIQIWGDTQIKAGANWRSEIQRALSKSENSCPVSNARFPTIQFHFRKRATPITSSRERRWTHYILSLY